MFPGSQQIFSLLKTKITINLDKIPIRKCSDHIKPICPLHIHMSTKRFRTVPSFIHVKPIPHIHSELVKEGSYDE